MWSGKYTELKKPNKKKKKKNPHMNYIGEYLCWIRLNRALGFSVS